MIPADQFYEELGSSIRKHREAKKLTQADVAVQLGLSRTSVTNVECGRQRLLIDQICRLAVILGCDLADLLAPALKERGQALKANADLRSMPTVAKFVTDTLIETKAGPA